MLKDITTMTNHELGTIAKAFAECKDCANCPCDGVICCVIPLETKRNAFMFEVAKRLMNE